MLEMLSRFVLALKLMRSDERGATAVEYGLMVALIAAVIIVAVRTLGVDVLGAFNSIDL
ncbi:MAG: Flp family type IVb pilin [Actinomycetota bacterium]